MGIGNVPALPAVICRLGLRSFIQRHRRMDIEEETGLLAGSPEYLEAVKVFPLIPHILKDATVGCISN